MSTAWRGPDYVEVPFIDEAGVGWIRAKIGGPINDLRSSHLPLLAVSADIPPFLEPRPKS